MSEDRELLEMAAKAAGIVGEFVTGYGSGDFYYQGNQDGILIRHPDGGLTVWNPLTDDGDALLLAVKLRLLVNISSSSTQVTDGLIDDVVELHRLTRSAEISTRRAIVRAAAEIGRSMV